MKIIFFAFPVLLVSSLVLAGTTGKIAGRVTDRATGEPLIGVNIIVEGTVLGAATDVNGNYVILNVPPGLYNVRAQYVGYQPVIFEKVSVSIDLTTKLDVSLSEAAVELDVVVVEARRDVIKKDITSSQSLVSSQQIQALPVSEFNDVLQLQAGVTRDAEGAFHIRGGRTSEISYWVNGVSITDAYDNSRGIQIDNNSIQELQVISGTFNAEYGNAMSGIVNAVTKEGKRDFHGGIVMYGGDHVSNFTEYFPHIDRIDPLAKKNVQGSLSGPIPFTGDLLGFYLNARYYYDDGYLFGERRYNADGTIGDGQVLSMNWQRTWYGQGNLSFSPVQGLKLNLEGLYSKEHFQDYDHSYRWNPDGNVRKFAESYSTTGTLTYMLSPSAFVTLKGSYFTKDFNEYLYDDPFDKRYLHPDSLILPTNYSFRTKGTNLHRFYRQTDTYLAKGDFTSQVSQTHLVKLGVEARSHYLRFDDYNLEPLRINNIPVEPFTPSIPGVSQPNRDKYKNKPLEASAYLQDKIEFENVIINVGLRLDYFDAKGKVLVDVADPNIYAPLRTEMELLSIEEREPHFYKDSEPKFQVSPRFGIAYPVSEDGVVYFSYGHFLQVPPFQYLFQKGPYKVPNSGSFTGVYGNPDLEPQKTVMYEVGFRQELFEHYAVDVTGFYRDVRDWITAGAILVTRNGVTYSIFTNKDYANVKGITLTVSRRFTDHFAFDLHYTYQVAEGSNSKPEDEFEAAKGNGEPSLFLIPMDWDQNHLLNASALVGIDGWGISLLARYGTGLPYTPSTTVYTAERGLGSGFLRNSRRRPSQFALDLKLDKTVRLLGFDVTAFLRVFNLLDNRVPVNVFGDTGQPDFTTETQSARENPDRPNTIEEYTRFPWHYGEPRSIQFGFDISF
ncbi:MAG: TonB-dependent receptor [Ignavibacteriales bacterium]|nr:TonB-dependent receptor [Ignavibacteriales bacterium]